MISGEDVGLIIYVEVITAPGEVLSEIAMLME